MYTTLIIILFLLFPVRVAAAGNVVSVDTARLVQHETTVDWRSDHLRSFLDAYGSPLAAEAEHFVAEADRLSLDWRLVAAIAGAESTFGKHIPYLSFNAWGWGIPTGSQYGVAFSSWKDGISIVSQGLRRNYVDRGAITVEQIGRIYAASPRWSTSVRFFIDKIDRFRPNDPQELTMTL